MSAFGVFYLVLIGALSVYGLHRYWLVWGATRGETPLPPTAMPTTPLPTAASLPTVLVQLPLFNEEPAVFRQLIASAVALDWPGETLEIQVLDDSTDGTSDVVRAEVERWHASGANIVHLHREDRVGFKAGALQAGLELSAAEFVTIFDADFVIPSDFLRRAMMEFEDPKIGMVQGRWGFTNIEHSWLTRIQSLMLDGHFHVEHRARARAGRFFNFNGTAGIWRVAAIRDVGGWQADTVTEDLDLSLRAWLAGWRFRYRDDLEAPSELPQSMAAYKVQQNRWVSGSIHTATLYLGRILRSDLSLRQKIDLCFYLTGNMNYLLLFFLVLAVPQAVLLRFDAGDRWLWADVPFFLAATVSVGFFYAQARRPEISRGSLFALRIPALMMLGLGMTIHNARAVVRGVFRRVSVFERTPKGAGSQIAPRRRRRDWTGWLEGAMAIYVLIGAVLSVIGGAVASLPFLGLFVGGYLYVFSRSGRPLVS